MTRALSAILTIAACALAVPSLILIGLSDLCDAFARSGKNEAFEDETTTNLPDGETKGGGA